jgi:hypothetical protein
MVWNVLTKSRLYERAPNTKKQMLAIYYAKPSVVLSEEFLISRAIGKILYCVRIIMLRRF